MQRVRHQVQEGGAARGGDQRRRRRRVRLVVTIARRAADDQGAARRAGGTVPGVASERRAYFAGGVAGAGEPVPAVGELGEIHAALLLLQRLFWGFCGTVAFARARGPDGRSTTSTISAPSSLCSSLSVYVMCTDLYNVVRHKVIYCYC